MDCFRPPPLTDDQLSDALDGFAGPDVQEHLAACPFCAARLAEAQQIEMGLHAQLNRWDCPSPQLLADYHLGRVGAEQDRAIIQHLAGCASCRAEIEDLRIFLKEDSSLGSVQTFAPPQPAPPAFSPRRALGPLIASLLPRSAAPALRGAQPNLLQAEAEGATIFLDVQPSDGQAVIQGQIVDDDLDRWEGALVEARSDGGLVATAFVDDLATFALGPLPPTSTELRLTPPGGRMILIPNVELNERA